MTDRDTTTTSAPVAAGTDWAAWQHSWDRQQEWYMPDREDRFRIMLDTVEAFVGSEPRVLALVDLGNPLEPDHEPGQSTSVTWAA